MKLKVLPLTREAFSPYGDVIETAGNDYFHINDGAVERYHDLAKVDILKQDRALISINRAQPATLPIVISLLERHPLGSQAFIPLNGEPFVVIVACGDSEPDPDTLRAFISNGQQGINYRRNVWHHPLFAWQKQTDFLTVDRAGQDNCEVMSIPGCELSFA
ncbi:ureidoglycolate hydrolase [Izhakiella australiensis]|uniref:Ureidoglycolate lyase n=1 Tax=Izhakiella australiensis TaxID=1926881 RepID=A0A1S8YTS3_9GAMM|nr:ureidoglycolate lyase [Izhakiella australiensis]OON42222.1 ureidoglycolate hydrolase [Izhakiella australiensis]